MKSSKSEKLRAAWDEGFWLRNSGRAFATDNQRKEWEKLDNVSALEQFQSAFNVETDTSRDFLSHFGSGLEAIQPLLQARSDLANTANANVLGWLQSAQLIGLGFESPRKLDCLPCLLPTEIWQGTIDWSDSAVRYQSLQFLDIRVVHPSKIEEHLKSDPATPSARGRPTVAHDLNACFEALSLEGAFDTSGSMKSQYPKIRAWLNENRTGENEIEFKVSDEAIRERFSPFFKILKDRS